MAKAGRVSDPLAQIWLDDLKRRATYLGLSTQDPFSVTDPLTVEPTATGYFRAKVDWTQTGRLLRNTNAVSWTGLPAASRIVAITAWTSATNGMFLWSIPIDPPNIPPGGGFPVGANQLFLGLDL